MSLVATFDPKAPVQVSDAACAHFIERLKRQPSAKGVRLSVKESGCSGYQYTIDYVENIPETDGTLALNDQYVLCVDSQALNIISGTLIDLVREGLNETIEFENPNIQSRCGCGESFTVTP
ncbi:MAG: iron-sulfur cluster assembly accessory protein [Gammaproteobacteria bacterium]